MSLQRLGECWNLEANSLRGRNLYLKDWSITAIEARSGSNFGCFSSFFAVEDPQILCGIRSTEPVIEWVRMYVIVHCELPSPVKCQDGTRRSSNKGKKKRVDPAFSKEVPFKRLRTLDVFAGCGGLSEGFHQVLLLSREFFTYF